MENSKHLGIASILHYPFSVVHSPFFYESSRNFC